MGVEGLVKYVILGLIWGLLLECVLALAKYILQLQSGKQDDGISVVQVVYEIFVRSSQYDGKRTDSISYLPL